MLRLLVVLFFALTPFGKTASAQYVQFSTNTFSLLAKRASAEVEVGLPLNFAVEGLVQYAPRADRGGLGEDVYRGWRRGVALKRYFGGSNGPHEGFFGGVYLHNTQLSMEADESSNFLFRGPAEAYDFRKNTIGLMAGWTLADISGVYLSMAGGLGRNFDQAYSCSDRGPRPVGASPGCRPSHTRLREQDADVYLQMSFGWRFRSASARLDKVEADLERKERQRALREAQDIFLEGIDPADFDLEARRLRHRLRNGNG